MLVFPHHVLKIFITKTDKSSKMFEGNCTLTENQTYTFTVGPQVMLVKTNQYGASYFSGGVL